LSFNEKIKLINWQQPKVTNQKDIPQMPWDFHVHLCQKRRMKEENNNNAIRS
jgi:hypothetical protein